MKIQNLKKRLGNFELDIPSLSLTPGHIHGLIGSNGSGKTTLAKLIMGILTPDAGHIDYEGLTARDITMTSQRPYLLHDTVYENLIYPLKVRKQTISREKAEMWLARCGLEEKRDQYARSLSSGEQQKLSFIRALIFEPKLILVDETLSNLDPDSASLFEELMLEQQKKNPVTWITISHQLVHIHRICDEVHFLSGGRWIDSGAPDEMLLHPKHPEVRAYLATTEVSYRGAEPEQA